MRKPKDEQGIVNLIHGNSWSITNRYFLLADKSNGYMKLALDISTEVSALDHSLTPSPEYRRCWIQIKCLRLPCRCGREICGVILRSGITKEVHDICDNVKRSARAYVLLV